MRRALPLLASLLFAACSDPVTTPTGDAAPPGDTPVGDATSDVTSDASADDAAQARCGTERPAVTGTSGTEGVVIGPDGAIYFSQANSVGRIAADGTRNNRWAVVTGATTMYGLAFDRARNRLYAGSPITRKIHAVDLSSDPPAVTDFVTNAGGPNGLTMGPDGFLYYSDFSGNQVYRVDGDGMRAQVTTTGISSANGVAFDATGNLLVVSYSLGRLYRLTLTDGVETGRTTLAMGLGRADGLALDVMGNIYITDQTMGRLVKLDPMGANPEDILTGLNAPANIEFGYGALPCTDIYVATGGGLRRYEDGTAAGAAVPWHR